METFNKCVATLRTAKSDSEKLAALMVISKISSSIKFTECNSRDLFDAISSQFLIRLIKSKPLGNNDANYKLLKSVGVNMVCLVAKVNPHVIGKEPVLLNELLLFIDRCANNKEEDNQVSGCMEILSSVSSTEEGSAVLCKLDIFVALKCALFDEHLVESTSLLLGNVTRNSLTWTNNFLELLTNLSNEFKSDQSLEKFKYIRVLRLLFQMLIDVNENIDENDKSLQQCLKSVSEGCSDILQSKIKSEVKSSVIGLIATICTACGFNWLFNKEIVSNQSHFILLVLTVILVEVSFLFRELVLQEHSSAALNMNAKSMYCILKGVITHLCSDDFMSSSLAKDFDFTVKAFTCMKNAMKPIYAYLSNVNFESGNVLDKSLMLASMKMVCFWATEETETLQEEVKHAIPLMMNLAQVELQDTQISEFNNEDSLFDVLTPCICQILPDNRMRKILLANQCIDVYVDHLVKLVQSQKISFLFWNAVHLMHQLTILEPQCVRENDLLSQTLDVLKNVALTALSTNEEAMDTHSKVELVALLFALVRMKEARNDSLISDIYDYSVKMLFEYLDFCLSSDSIEMWIIAAQNLMDFTMKNETRIDTFKNSTALKKLMAKRDGKYKQLQDIFTIV